MRRFVELSLCFVLFLLAGCGGGGGDDGGTGSKQAANVYEVYVGYLNGGHSQAEDWALVGECEGSCDFSLAGFEGDGFAIRAKDGSRVYVDAVKNLDSNVFLATDADGRVYHSNLYYAPFPFSGETNASKASYKILHAPDGEYCLLEDGQSTAAYFSSFFSEMPNHLRIHARANNDPFEYFGYHGFGGTLSEEDKQAINTTYDEFLDFYLSGSLADCLLYIADFRKDQFEEQYSLILERLENLEFSYTRDDARGTGISPNGKVAVWSLGFTNRHASGSYDDKFCNDCPTFWWTGDSAGSFWFIKEGDAWKIADLGHGNSYHWQFYQAANHSWIDGGGAPLE